MRAVVPLGLTALALPTGRVRLGIDAPHGSKIQCTEVIQAVAAANAEAAAAVGAEEQLKQALGGLTLNKPGTMG